MGKSIVANRIDSKMYQPAKQVVKRHAPAPCIYLHVSVAQCECDKGHTTKSLFTVLAFPVKSSACSQNAAVNIAKDGIRLKNM
jgi:hypothetical protein